jgi:hypothetical protein
MRIQILGGKYIEEVLAITPLEADDWLVEFYYNQSLGDGKTIKEMHLDPAVVVKIYE